MDDSLADERLERWRAVAGGDREQTFARRLALDGLDASSARWAVLPAPGPDSGTWPATAEAVVAAAAVRPRPTEPDPLPLPFVDALRPFLDVALERLSTRRPREPRDPLEPLGTALLVDLSDVLAPVLAHEFALFRGDARGGIGRWATPAGGGRERYEAFVGHLLDGDWAAVFAEYPVLARLSSTVVADWIDATGEFLERLERDRDALASLSPGGLQSGLAALRPLSGERHGGRRGWRLDLSDGRTLAYKPRPLSPEAAFREIAAAISSASPDVEIAAPAVLDRGAYGWMAWAEPRPARGRTEERAYYRNFGALVAAVYALAGTDVHEENVIAAGPVPTLVDAETIPYPRAAWDPGGPEADSVLETHLLPTGSTGASREISALAGGAGRVERRLRWRDVNTDGMAFGPEDVEVREGANRPAPGVDPAAHGDDVLRGFEAGYRAILARREALLGSEIQERIARATVRYVPRPTRIYGSVLEESLRPLWMRSGIDWEIELEAIAPAIVERDDAETLWPLVRAELGALKRLDVPCFRVPADSRDLELGPEGRIEGFFSESAAERARKRLERMGEGDRSVQKGWIERSLRRLAAGPEATT